MKGIFKSKARKAFLTAAISLALSSSVFAMPQGGVVRDGDVNISGVTTAANGTIDVTGLGLVDWNSFNLANGETLTFILKDAANGDSANLINRVVGQNMSEIYGHMVSQGEGGVILVNPNGILIGNGAQIDVGSLLLSAGNFTDANYQTFKETKNFTVQADPNMQLKVDAGANIKFYDTLMLLGGKVQIADNVTISNGLARLSEDGTGTLPVNEYNDENSMIAAAKQVQVDFNSGSWSTTTESGNDVSIGKANITALNPEILENSITLNGTTLAAKDYVDMFAGNSVTYDNTKDEYQLSATSANNISVKNTTLTSMDPMIFGGKVDISDLSITATGDKGEIDINALNTYKEVTGGKDTWEATKDNTLTISNTKLTNSTKQDNFIELQGGNVKLTDVTTDSTGIEIAAKSGYTEEGMDPNTVTHNLASDGMDVSISGGSITTTEDIGVTGKTITTNGTTFKAGENIVFAAGKDAYAKDDFNTVGVTAEADDLVSVTGGSLDAGKSIRMYGGSAKLDGVSEANTEGYADVVAGAQIDYHRTLNETTKEYDDGYTLDATSANAITVKDSNVTAADGSVIYGGKIDVSGSTIENTGKEGEIRIDALNTLQESQGDNDTWKSTKDNAVTVSNTTLKNASTTDDDDAIEIEGGAVSLTGATVTGKNIYVASKSGYNETDTESHNYASDGMDTSVKDSTLTATGSIDVTGKTVTLDGATTLHAGNGMVVATGSDVAVKDAANGQGLPEVTTTDGTDVLVGKNVKLEGTQIVKPGTKTIGETPTEPTQPTTPTDPGTKPSEPTQPTTPTDPGTKPSEPTTPTTPTDPGTTPSEPTTPTTPTTKDAAEVVAALEKSTTDEAKRAVIRASEPTAEATEVAKQKQSEESSTENVQVASIEAQDVLPTTTESSTATVIVDGEAED